MSLHPASEPPPAWGVSFVETEWHRISVELETERAMARLGVMLDREPSWDDVRLLASLRDVVLDQSGQLMRLMATRRVTSFLDGETVRDVVGLVGERAGADHMAERTARHEVGIAMGRTKDQADMIVASYRRLVTEFPAFVSALTAGTISMGHCHVLLDETLLVEDPDEVAQIGEKALPLAQHQPTSRFRTSVRRLVQRYDSNAAARRRAARQQRRVAIAHYGDGISGLTVVARTEDVEAMRQAIEDAAQQLLAADRAAADAATQRASDTSAASGSDGESAESAESQGAESQGAESQGADGGVGRLTVGQARSDAVVAALLGRVDSDGTVTYVPKAARQVRLELVVDVETAARIRDNLARLGEDPICAGVARSLFLDVEVVSRILVAEGSGHLLDEGQDVYLSERHRRHVRRRDRLACRCCGRRATQGEMDHIVEFLRGGPSATRNEWWLCRECHQRKTAGQLTFEGRADDDVVITTPSGLVFVSPPPPYLDEPERDSVRAAQAPPVGFRLPGRSIPARVATVAPAAASPVAGSIAEPGDDPPPF
jgi:hypothetical protein